MRRLLYPALLAIAVLLPFVNAPYVVQGYTRILVVAVVVQGLNVLTGYGGVMSLGHGAFFGVGAYTAAILSADHGWPWYAAALPAVAFAGVLGAVVGVPALRIRGLHLAILTLALGALFPYLVTALSGITRGNQGKVTPTMRPPDWLPLERDQFAYFVCLAVVVVVMAATAALAGSRSGRAMLAMRENETAAVMVGVDTARVTITAFGLSAGLAGLAGALFVSTQGIVSSETTELTLTGSISFVAALIIGGATTVLGPLVGAVITHELPDLLSTVNPVLAPVAYGALLVVVIMLLPKGIVGAIGERLRKRRPQAPPPDSSTPSTKSEATHVPTP